MLMLMSRVRIQTRHYIYILTPQYCTSLQDQATCSRWLLLSIFIVTRQLRDRTRRRVS